MHHFDYRFLHDPSLSSDILGISGIIMDLNAREQIREQENPKVFEALRSSAIIDSIRSSNAIEGIVTTKQRYAELLSNQSPATSHAEAEILGYQKALSGIYTSGKQPLSEELIRHFHSLLLSDSSLTAGQYKTENNWIQERNAEGKIRVRFVPVSVRETPEAMEQLLLAFHEARQDATIHPLLLIACFTVDFLCIHPFEDGNGRVSRLITVQLLENAGYPISRYISVDRTIHEYLYGYYDALQRCSQNWHESQNTYIPFMIYFLQILYRCYKEMDDRFVKNQVKRVPKAKQVENLLLNSFVPISKEEIQQRLPDISVITIERVLSQMVRQDQIVKIGSYRDARYKVK